MKTYRRFVRFLRPYWMLVATNILGSALFSLLSALSMSLVQPMFSILSQETAIPKGVSVPATGLAAAKEAFTAWMARIITGATPLDALEHLSLLIISIFLLKNAIKYVTEFLKSYVSDHVIKDIRDALFRKLTSLSLGYFQTTRAGLLISRVTNDVTVLNDSIAPLFSVLITEPLQIVLYLSILIMISWQLTLVTAAAGVSAFLLVRVLGRWIRRYSGRIQQRMGDVTVALQEGLANIRIVKAYAAEDRETAKFARHTLAHFRAAVKLWRTSHLINPINEIFAISALTVVLWIGGQQALAHTISSANLIWFIVSVFALMSPVNSIAGFYTQIQRGRAAADALAAILDEQPAVRSGSKTVASTFRDIEIRDVTFAYGAVPAVEQISLTIKQGDTVALVGPSGSGKSTLADLVLRFYDPQNGTITLDGTDIREFNTVAYRGLFGVVTQEAMLFNDTVRNNIAYGMPDATDAQVRDAARVANAEEFILRLPEGYDTLIGDRGTRLSGGERQRLAIARAVLPNPRILIFDEATSALDSQSEQLVQQAIERLLADRTAIIIAHRLSTIQVANTIVVLERGRIVQTGSHADLVQGGGLYQKLYAIQMGFEGNGKSGGVSV